MYFKIDKTATTRAQNACRRVALHFNGAICTRNDNFDCSYLSPLKLTSVHPDASAVKVVDENFPLTQSFSDSMIVAAGFFSNAAISDAFSAIFNSPVVYVLVKPALLVLRVYLRE
mmetsp:Transcript_637/g.767  ORF Transcript_637/g.767 Transcript_637/m.767 type:complete len:115 (-) Transcript_637:1025-1369(-)